MCRSAIHFSAEQMMDRLNRSPLRDCSLNLVFAGSLLAAVINTFGQQSTTETTTDSKPAEFKADIDIGGRKLEMASYGQGTPTVIVEAGLSDHPVESGTWDTVVAAIAKTTRICVYDRAGLGQSQPATNALRTSQDVVKDLHALLANGKVPPPYILVGHSIGGFAVRLYATQYPEEVAGVVLVDSSHPDQWPKLLAALPPQSSDEPEGMKGWRKFLTALMTNPTNNPERMDFMTSAAQVRASGNFGDKPLVVLSHSPNWRFFFDLPDEDRRKYKQIFETTQMDLCRLSSNSIRMIASKGGHFIQTDDPQVVIEAILKVVDASKAR
jgi:pimeloyl-ACP methyl ester carboxylesterase